VGTPAASDVTLAPGAGHGGEGDASLQGPAQEEIETLPAQPKPTQEPTNKPTNAAAPAETEPKISAGAVIELKSRIRKPKAADATAVAAEGRQLATAHPKPEKRLNAKERARAKFKAKNGSQNGAKDDAKKDAKNTAKDGTTPMTAKAKSKAETKAKKGKAA
jgi:hypothetical protein